MTTSCQIITAKSYTCTVDGANKFWTIDIVDNMTITRYGKIGYQGQMSKKYHQDSYEAKRFSIQKIQEKLNKGYKENTSGSCGLPADAKIEMLIPNVGQATFMVCAGCFENVKAKQTNVKVLELL